MAKLSRHDYTVGWICALPLESAAAWLMLEKIHPGLDIPQEDRNTYTLGNIGKHNVVIAYLPSGGYGTVPAATVAVQLRTTFPSLRFGLMVGIGGGVPSSGLDIRLGDIVVSLPKQDCGGVIQYDFGKSLSGGRFDRTGMLNRPPEILLTAISKLRSYDDLKCSQVPEFISHAQAKRAKFARPQQEDRLFQAGYTHRDGDTCKECDPAQIIRRSLRSNNDPVVHYGLIASANQVMKDSRRRDQLAKEFGVCCVEMEAAGVMNIIPCLVIRGISDYADSHKNKEWQRYAAIAAAAYAKELILVVSTNLSNHPSTTQEEKAMNPGHRLNTTAANTLDVLNQGPEMTKEVNNWSQQIVAEHGDVPRSDHTKNQESLEENSAPEKRTHILSAIKGFASLDILRLSSGTAALHITEECGNPPIQLSKDTIMQPEPVRSNNNKQVNHTTLKGHSGLVECVAFSPNGKTIGSGSLDNQVRLWNATKGITNFVLSGHSDRVNTIVFSPDGRLLASGSRDKTVRLWDTTKGTIKVVLNDQSGRVRTIKFSPDGTLVASESFDGDYKLWHSTTGNMHRISNDPYRRLTAVEFSPDSRMVAFGTHDDSLGLWNNDTGTFQTLRGTSVEKVNYMTFSPDGSILACVVGKKITLWNTTTCTMHSTLSSHSQRINTMAFSPDGALVASGSSDRTVRLWQTGTGTMIKILTGHSKPVNAVAFSPNGTITASGSDDKTVRLWDVSTGATQTFKGYWGKNCNSLAFSPDGRLVAYPSGENIKICSTGIQN
ncbi:WD40-repeat-containing domain protein [Aspergillus pseudotamarii]|uniref:WD40-repeat-containing domain protein n=1 Tax=Aspergillus pseudotamarii TaxID=132259 RepID=A0A5N6T6Q5_ASPPS|nr:WD40-repeat-containing domain protein [Aspergillus pseudotamarii]KAE8141926.1 WD40-repeat-containing domain protein [Aspergillus pseudotamarii]